MVFCGECGASIATAGGRKDAPKGRDAGKAARAQTLAGALPGVPVSPSQAPPPPMGKATLAMPSVAAETAGASGDRSSRPSDVGRQTVVGMALVTRGGAETPPHPPVTRGGAETPQSRPSPKSRRSLRGVRGAGRRGAARAWSRRGRAASRAPRRRRRRIEVVPISESTLEPTPPLPLAPPVAPAAAPQPRVAPSVPPHEADETKRLLEDLDAGFESIVAPLEPLIPMPVRQSVPPVPRVDDDWGPAPESPLAAAPPRPSEAARAARHEADMDEVRELFAGIAVAYARPLRDFMIEVAWGEPTKEWLDVALPATAALRRAAAAVELPALDAALEGYAAALELAVGEASIHREVREMLAGAYARLVEAMPSVFALEGERGRREPIIVRSLLMQVPGVHKVAVDKLYAAGVNGLDVFYAARPRELAEATGLDEPSPRPSASASSATGARWPSSRPARIGRRSAPSSRGSPASSRRQHEEHERAVHGVVGGRRRARGGARARSGRTPCSPSTSCSRTSARSTSSAPSPRLPFQQKIRELYRYLDEARDKASRS